MGICISAIVQELFEARHQAVSIHDHCLISNDLAGLQTYLDNFVMEKEQRLPWSGAMRLLTKESGMDSKQHTHKSDSQRTESKQRCQATYIDCTDEDELLTRSRDECPSTQTFFVFRNDFGEMISPKSIVYE